MMPAPITNAMPKISTNVGTWFKRKQSISAVKTTTV